MEGQRKGDCGHIMASVDPHGLCVRCRECDLVNAPCSVCLATTSVQREAAQLAYVRRWRRLQRRKDRASSVCSSSLQRDGGQGPPVTPSTWVDGRESAFLQAQIDGEPASPRDRAWVDGCSADSSPRRVESRSRVRHSQSRMPIGRRHRSPSADRETSEPEPILPYSGLDEDDLDADRGCWLVPNRTRVDRRLPSPVAIPVSWRGLQRGPGPGPCPSARLRSLTRLFASPGHGLDFDSVRAPSGSRVRFGTRSGALARTRVWYPVRASRGVRAPARASVDDRSRSRLRDRHSSSSRSSDSDDEQRTFQQAGRSPRAASAEHPLATVLSMQSAAPVDGGSQSGQRDSVRALGSARAPE